MQTISTVFAKAGILLLLLIAIATTAQSQVSATAFRDFNFNGVRTSISSATSLAELLVPGIIVYTYNNSNVIIAPYTTTNSSYTAAVYSNTGNNFGIPASGTAYNPIKTSFNS